MSFPAVPPRPRQIAAPIRAVRRWAPTLVSITLDKPQDFSFTPGHYVRLGVPDDAGGETVWRAYSIVSSPDAAELEFLITLIPDGALTGRLAAMQPGDTLMLETAALGFFLADQLSPGKHLWMLATGTGLGPYIAMLRHPALLAGYSRLILAHSVRHADELAYADELRQLAADAPDRFNYLPIVTRETVPGCLQGRIPALLADGTLAAKVRLPFDPAESRVMVCGNPDFTAAMRAFLNERGFLPCRRGLAGSMLFEKYW